MNSLFLYYYYSYICIKLNTVLMKDIQKEITPISSDDLFIVLNHPNAKFDYPVHYHSDYEINLVMNTYGERIVGDSVEKFDNLDLVMTGPIFRMPGKGRL